MYPIHFEVFVYNSATLFSVHETKVLLNNDFIKGPKKKMSLQKLMGVSDTCIHTQTFLTMYPKMKLFIARRIHKNVILLSFYQECLQKIDIFVQLNSLILETSIKRVSKVKLAAIFCVACK